MRRLTSHHRPQTHHSVELAGLGDLLGNQRQFECAGHAEDLDVLRGRAVPQQAVFGPAEQPAGEELVVAAHNQRKALAAGV